MNRLSRACLAAAAAIATDQRIGGEMQTVYQNLSATGDPAALVSIIEATRKKNRISVERLCASAGVAVKTYQLIRQRPEQARVTTMLKLVDGLRKLQSASRRDTAQGIVSVETIPGGMPEEAATQFEAALDEFRASDHRINNYRSLRYRNLSATSENAARLSIIEGTRKKIGIGIARLCVAAGVAVMTYHRIRRRPEGARTATILKLADGLRKLRSANRHDAAQSIASVEMIYGGFLAAAASHYGVSPEQVRESNPRAGTTADATWRACAHARQTAVYLCNVAGGISQRAIARAVGLTEAAVCLSIQSIEDRREDPAFDRFVDQAAKAVTGRIA